MPKVEPPSNTYYQIYPEASDDLFNPEVDWYESAEGENGGDAHFATDGGSGGSLSGWVRYNKLRNFILYALGYAAADSTEPWYMRRINPPTHPLFPWLRARAVTLRGLGPRKKQGAVAGVDPTPSSVVPPWFPYASGQFPPGTQDPKVVTSAPDWDGVVVHPSYTLPPRMASMRPRQSGEKFASDSGSKWMASGNDRAYFPFSYRTTRYTWAKVTVDFAQPKWPIKEDTDPTFDPTDESDRNVFWTTEPSLDVIAMEGGVGNGLFWREQYTATHVPVVATNIPTTSTTSVTPITSGFKAPTGILNPRLMDCANWQGVPTRFIFDANLIPTKILSCIGKTNLTDWFGYKRGTALLIGASFEPVAWPIYSTDHHVVNLWSVRLMFKYADPPRRPNSQVTPAPGANPARGHRLVTYQDGFAYLATRFDDTGLYQEAEYRNLFKHIEAT